MKQSKVGLLLHRQGIDTSTAAGNAFFQMLGLFAEFERALSSSASLGSVVLEFQSMVTFNPYCTP